MLYVNKLETFLVKVIFHRTQYLIYHVYVVDVYSREGNQLHSRLHVKNVTDADYRGWYECWLTIALSGTANRTLVRFEPRSKCSQSILTNIIVPVGVFN